MTTAPPADFRLIPRTRRPPARAAPGKQTSAALERQQSHRTITGRGLSAGPEAPPGIDGSPGRSAARNRSPSNFAAFTGRLDAASDSLFRGQAAPGKWDGSGGPARPAIARDGGGGRIGERRAPGKEMGNQAGGMQFGPCAARLPVLFMNPISHYRLLLLPGVSCYWPRLEILAIRFGARGVRIRPPRWGCASRGAGFTYDGI